MNNAYILQLLQEMKDNCYKDKGYLDAKRMDQAEALNFAIFLVKQETPKLKRKKSSVQR